MRAALDLILFLLTGLATGALSVIGAGGGLCAALAGGWLYWRRRRRDGNDPRDPQ